MKESNMRPNAKKKERVIARAASGLILVFLGNQSIKKKPIKLLVTAPKNIMSGSRV
jgi:hypothetical protein